ncbi:MAG: transposase [Desulfamplus sp.]|nr:transposase [Desulfamplus sp.]
MLDSQSWRKLHLAINETTREIVASTLTTNKKGDPSQVAPLLDQMEEDISKMKADGAYDRASVYHVLSEQGIQGIFPPGKDAILSKKVLTEPTPRDLNILFISEKGRKVWEQETGYSMRNLVENTMFRYKKIIGGTLRSKEFDSQKVETQFCQFCQLLTGRFSEKKRLFLLLA